LQRRNQALFSQQALHEDIEAEEAVIQRLDRTIDTLQAVKVYEDAFHIDVLSPLPTINGFSLGVEPGKAPEWKSINEAWGQCAVVLGQLISLAKPSSEGSNELRSQLRVIFHFSLCEPLEHGLKMAIVVKCRYAKTKRYRIWARGARAYVEDQSQKPPKSHPLFSDKDPNATSGSLFAWVWTSTFMFSVAFFV
jgi:hypothetical protein